MAVLPITTNHRNAESIHGTLEDRNCASLPGRNAVTLTFAPFRLLARQWVALAPGMYGSGVQAASKFTLPDGRIADVQWRSLNPKATNEEHRIYALFEKYVAILKVKNELLRAFEAVGGSHWSDITFTTQPEELGLPMMRPKVGCRPEYTPSHAFIFYHGTTPAPDVTDFVSASNVEVLDDDKSIHIQTLLPPKTLAEIVNIETVCQRLGEAPPQKIATEHSTGRVKGFFLKLWPSS